MTAQRQIIWDIVKNSDMHPSAMQIFDVARARGHISMATVYNSLNYLVENGYIRRVEIAGEPDRFDRRLEEHYHALCDCCRQVVDVELDGIVHNMEQRYQIKVISCGLNLHCVCSECLKKQQCPLP